VLQSFEKFNTICHNFVVCEIVFPTQRLILLPGFVQAMLRKILIANRGEIAVRIIRACAEMGIRSVAVYSEADRFALHVKKADESYCIGSEPVAGYLNIYGLVNLAAATGCDAIHPGYGFLSENTQFAKACKERGLIFIGPEADVIHRMGDKTEARKAMIAAGIPVTPGFGRQSRIGRGSIDSGRKRSVIRSC
jgi:acetyl/propionyl-CoA carboxylase alpha subunit